MNKMQNQQRHPKPSALKPTDTPSIAVDADKKGPIPAESSSAVPTQLPSNAGVKKKKAKKKKS